MHITFQFPLIDCRPLQAMDTGKLNLPEWPVGGTKPKRFIKHFGAVEKRMAGGSDDWPGEDFYCNSHLTLRFEDLQHLGYEPIPGAKPAIFNSYRRYTADEHFLGRMEVGFVDNGEKIFREKGLPPGSVNIEAAIKHYANLPITLNGKKEKLFRAGPGLAHSYYLASTTNKVTPVEKQKMVIAGEVAVVVVFSGLEQFKLPRYISLVKEFMLPGEQTSLKLYGGSLNHEDDILKIWLIEMPAGYNRYSIPVREKLRNLRINLLRIHLEKETIRLLLNGIRSKHIQFDSDSTAAQLVNDYFEKTLESIFRKNRYSFPQENILAFALKSEDAAAPGSFSSLEDGINIFKKKFIRKNINKLLNGMSGMEKKTILLICACPADKNPLRFTEEYQVIKNIWRASTDRDSYEDPKIEATVKKNEFLLLLNRYKPDYLHIAMHSSIKEGLLFENDEGEKLPMPVTEFAELIAQIGKIHKLSVVIISACNSKPHAEALKGFCNYAVGTKVAIPDEAAILYAKGFYETMMEGNADKIPYCHENGKIYIKQSGDKFEHSTIEVYDIPILIN